MSTSDTVRLYTDIHKTIDKRGALVVTYRTKGITPKARVMLPQALHTTKDGADVIYAWDSIRNTKVSFRVDRIAQWHVLPVAGVA
jgi:predicted DNA-binding transcriptional regulator YafY